MKKHVWMVECKFVCNNGDSWDPVIAYSDGTPPVWLTRETARLAARHMEKTNGVNDKFLVVRYRAVKYNRKKK